jgi:hypothetical protein
LPPDAPISRQLPGFVLPKGPNLLILGIVDKLVRLEGECRRDLGLFNRNRRLLDRARRRCDRSEAAASLCCPAGHVGVDGVDRSIIPQLGAFDPRGVNVRSNISQAAALGGCRAFRRGPVCDRGAPQRVAEC